MKGMRFLQLSIFLVLSLTSFGQGISGSRVGKDFWMGHMNNYSSPGNPKLYICGDNMTAGKVEIPLQGWTQNFIVTPGVATVINLPPALSHNVLNDAIEKRGVHITALENVSVIAADESVFTSDAAAILPTGLLGSEYVVSTYKGFGGVRRSEFLIVATENGTVIDITP